MTDGAKPIKMATATAKDNLCLWAKQEKEVLTRANEIADKINSEDKFATAVKGLSKLLMNMPGREDLFGKITEVVQEDADLLKKALTTLGFIVEIAETQEAFMAKKSVDAGDVVFLAFKFRDLPVLKDPLSEAIQMTSDHNQWNITIAKNITDPEPASPQKESAPHSSHGRQTPPPPASTEEAPNEDPRQR